MSRYNTTLNQTEFYNGTYWFSSNAIVQSGLVCNLDAGNPYSYPGSGNTWTDLTTNGNNGFLTNGPTYTSNNAGGIVFDGSDDYVGITSVLLSGSDNFTINLWIQCNPNENVGTIFGNYPAGNLQIFYGTGVMGMWLNNNSTYVDAPIPFSSSPVMITAIRSGTTTYFYQNANLLKTGSSSASIGTTNNFRLGENTATTEEYTGTIFVLQVYNRALTVEEIQQNFNALRGRYRV